MGGRESVKIGSHFEHLSNECFSRMHYYRIQEKGLLAPCSQHFSRLLLHAWLIEEELCSISHFEFGSHQKLKIVYSQKSAKSLTLT